MRLSRISALCVAAGMLTAGAAFLRASPGAEPGPEGHASHGHEGVPEKFPEHPAVGEPAPDFSLRNLDGRWRALGESLGRGHVVVFFGSASSETFLKVAPQMDRLARDWEKLEVKVVLVYTREAHPAALGKKAPRDYQERVALARKVCAELKLAIPVLVDEWDDAVHKAYGAMPDAAFLLDSRGTILARQARAGATSLGKELSRLLKVSGPPG